MRFEELGSNNNKSNEYEYEPRIKNISPKISFIS
jgi:hypothetical protein